MRDGYRSMREGVNHRIDLGWGGADKASAVNVNYYY